MSLPSILNGLKDTSLPKDEALARIERKKSVKLVMSIWARGSTKLQRMTFEEWVEGLKTNELDDPKYPNGYEEPAKATYLKIKALFRLDA